MKKLIIISIMLISNNLIAQDTITKRDGTIIRAKITGKSYDAITYKEYDAFDRVEHWVSKKDLKKITYGNGEEEYYRGSKLENIKDYSIFKRSSIYTEVYSIAPDFNEKFVSINYEINIGKKQRTNLRLGIYPDFESVVSFPFTISWMTKPLSHHHFEYGIGAVFQLEHYVDPYNPTKEWYFDIPAVMVPLMYRYQNNSGWFFRGGINLFVGGQSIASPSFSAGYKFLYKSASAQENSNPPLKLHRNYIHTYIGVVDININYERNLFQFHHSYTNIRAGFGWMGTVYWTNGTYVNISLVHLIGEKNSHLELNLGYKYITNGDVYGNMPDVYVGYRYEKPEGKFIFRTGISATTLGNLGIGFKF